jgi:hypothetical protein
MAQDEVIVVYKAVPEGFDKVGVAVNSVTNETKELQTQIKATFADKSIENATRKLYEQGDVMGALINEYGNATSALKAMEKELITMAALGQNGTKEFKELAKATAELKDTVGDTRGEIKKMASDTRVFDTMVQGARGVAAAFSVATGVAAAFGSENKNVEKALLKVQGAMAALQGVQELANIATEKGGIATKAYGVALTVVDRISKLTGLSMAASWAMATAGITLIIAGVVSLIYWLGVSDDKAKENAEKQKERDEEEIERLKRKKEAQNIQNEIFNAALDQFDKEQEQRRKQAFLNNENLKELELKLLKEKLASSINDLGEFHKHEEFMDYVAAQKYKQKLEDRVLDTRVALKKIQDELAKGIKPETPGIAAFKPSNEDNIEPLITEEIVSENKTNADQMAKDIRDSIEKTKKDEDLYRSTKLSQEAKLWSEIFSLTQSTVTAINSFVQMGYDTQLQGLTQSKEKEIAQAGDNAEKKKKIDQKYAVEFAKIERQKAIAEKSAAIFGIAIGLAATIQKIQAEAALLASNPVTAALAGNAYAQLGIAVASAALQIGVISAKPLPEIPKFEKGGAVALAGGRIDNGYLIGRSHREGGILIEAQGKEYIWDEQTTAKHGDIIQAAHENRIEDLMMHKYVVPMIRSQQQSNNSESYDDMLLRATIKSSNKQMSKEIVKGISKNMSDAIYLTSRYKS